MPTPTLAAPRPTCPICQVDALSADAPFDATQTSRLADFFRRLFDTSDYPPRWHCGTWSAEVGWLHICSDVAIFAAYAAIPATLLFFIVRRRDVPLRAIFWLFAAFILSCGVTHLTDATMFYAPAYRFLGLMKLVTAAVSLATVVALARVLPAALSLPGLAQAHALARDELLRRQETEAQLLKLRDQMEDRNSRLTAETHRLRAAMRAARVAAVRWSPQTGTIDWQIGLADAVLPTMSGVIDNWSQVLAPAEVEALLAASLESVRTRRPMMREVRLGLADLAEQRLLLSASPDGPTMSGMARVLEGPHRPDSPRHPPTAG